MNKNIPSWINPLWYQFENSFAKGATYMINIFLFRLLFNKKTFTEFPQYLQDLF